MDVPRRGKAKDSRFEMSVLIAVNEVLLKSEVSSDEEAQAIVDAEVTAAQTVWDALSEEEKAQSERPADIILTE